MKEQEARSAELAQSETGRYPRAMPEFANDTFLRALRREPTPWTPVWLMRQAGRYLPEYQRTRAKAGSFLALAQSPDLATEVTLQPLERFPLDAAILFSDILTVPDAMGLGLGFAEGEGPRFAHKTADEASIRELAVPDMGRLAYVFDAVRGIKRALGGRRSADRLRGQPVHACVLHDRGWRPRGFSDGANDGVRAAGSARPSRRCQCGSDRRLSRRTDRGGRGRRDDLRHMGRPAVRRRVPQVFAGPDANGARRAAPGPSGRRVPTIVFTKGGGAWLDELAASGANAVGLDWTVDLAEARRRVGARVALQGNLDPLVLLTDPETVRREAAAVVRAAGPAAGHVFNLGHGILPETPPEHVAVLVDTVHSESRAIRAAA